MKRLFGNAMWLAGLMALGLLAGCKTTTPELVSFRDDRTGETTEMISDNLIAPERPGDAYVWLNASRLTRWNGRVLYYLEIHYESPAVWLNIDMGQTLTVFADNDELRLFGQGSFPSRDTGKDGQVMETAIYETNTDTIRKIASAKEVLVRLTGSQLTIERRFQPDNFELFKQFVDKYLDRKK